MKILPILTLALIGMAGAARAQAYDAAPVVNAQAGADSAADVTATFDIAAAPDVVWKTLTDCEHATSFMPKLISCKILEKGPADRWEIREHVLNGGLFRPRIRNVFRADFTKDRKLEFHKVGGDWKKSEGSWTLSPVDGGKGTHVVYHTEVAIDGPVPREHVPLGGRQGRARGDVGAAA
jgi:uncharacterized protein YndB with AHSA1/START domain